MISRASAIVLSCLVASGCAYPDIDTGGQCTFGAMPSRCRPGYLCAPDNQCTKPCDAGQTRSCPTSDGGAGQTSCLGDAWSACLPTCQSELCGILRGTIEYYAERTCQSDGGLGACLEVAASRCTSRPFGMCADAGRVRADSVGCTSLSYGRLPGFADIESCPSDSIDNDCDGYTDELFAVEAALVCAPGPICRTQWPDGRFKAYRTCEDPTCLDSGVLIAELSDAGYLPLDRCDDNVDRDCSGEAGAGPPVFLRRAEEAIALGDPYQGDPVAFKVVTVDPLPDGGLEITYTTWTPTLGEAAAPSPVGMARRDGAPINPNLQLGGGTSARSLIAWRSGPSTFGLAHAFGNAVSDVREFFSPYPILDTPEVAQLGRDVVVAAQIMGDQFDGGIGPITYLSPIADLEASGSVVDAGTIVPDVPVRLSGDGAQTVGVYARLGGSSAWLELGLDAGLTSSGFTPYGTVALFRYRALNVFAGDKMAIAAIGARRFNMAITSQFVETVTYTLEQPTFETTTVLPAQLTANVSDLTLVVRELSDGGTKFLAGGRLPGGLGGLFDSTSVVRSVGPVAGRVSLAVAPELPDYALLTLPRAEDAGTAIYGQLVCMPR